MPDTRRLKDAHDVASETQEGVVQLAPSGGTTAGQAVQPTDARLSDSRPPSGTAGGVLSGTYPDPTFAADMATQLELDTVAAAAAAAQTTADAAASDTDLSDAITAVYLALLTDRTKLTSQVAYEDEANTFVFLQTISPAAPASVGTTPGTAAGAALAVTGQPGGASTASGTAAGGAGGGSSLTGGAGGQATAAGTASTGGAGGTSVIAGGVGGLAAVAGTGANTGGAGGVATHTSGAGGDATGATSGTNTGGAGGTAALRSGAGGAASGGTGNHVGGNGGILLIQTGNGGSVSGSGGSGYTPGNGGALTFTPGVGGNNSVAGSAANVGGVGSTGTFRGGSGGIASGSTTQNTGGIGGQGSFLAGNGGAANVATAGTNTGGVGGPTVFAAGAGGAASNGAVNNGGAGGASSFRGGVGGVGTTANGVGGAITFSTAPTTTLIEAMRIDNAQRVGIGTTSPTARLHLAAGVASASGAPLKLTAGVVLTTPEAGAFGYDGTDLFFTPVAARRTVAFKDGIPRALGWYYETTPAAATLGPSYPIDVNMTLTGVAGWAEVVATGSTAQLDIQYKRGAGAWTTIFSALPGFAVGANALTGGTISFASLNAGDFVRLRWQGTPAGIADITVSLQGTTR